MQELLTPATAKTALAGDPDCARAYGSKEEDSFVPFSQGLRTWANKNAGPSGLMFGRTTVLFHHLRAAGADLDSLRSPGPKGPGYPLFMGARNDILSVD
jgi:hypothetical protein